MTAHRTGALVVETARQVCALPDPPEAREVLGSLLVRGERTLLGGHTGEGKTTLSLQMIHAATTGGEFLGFTGVGGRSLVIDAEQGLRTVKRRLREARLDESDGVDYLRVPDGLRLDRDEADADRLEAVLAAGGYSVVFFDPLYKLQGGDSNDERDAVELMRRLDAWRERFDFALLLATHCRKPPPRSRFSLHDLFGSSAYLRGAEVVLGLQRVGPGRSRLHLFKDRFGDLPQGEIWKLDFDRERGFRRDLEADHDAARAVDLVKAALSERPGSTKRELQEATGKAERTVAGALTAIGAVGDARRPKRWWPPGQSE